MKVRKYKEGEEEALWGIFYNTIHKVNINDYSEEQVAAWAPLDFDQEIWANKIRSINPFVVENDGVIIGYADLQLNGLIDHFYCHYQWQRKGVGTILMEKIYEKAKYLGIQVLTSEVSITAKPFYISHGFSVTNEQCLVIRGNELNNFYMEKQLTNAST